MKISVQRAAILSYMQGLAPVGTEVWIYVQHICNDLSDMGFHNVDTVRQLLHFLMKDGIIERVCSHVYIVKRRVEEFEIELQGSRATKADPLWRMYGDEPNEVPMRGMPARMRGQCVGTFAAPIHQEA